MQLSFDPPFMPLQTAALAVVACAAIFWLMARVRSEALGKRRIALVGLRALLVGILTLILLNPVIVVGKELPKGKQSLILLIDTSRSMRTPDAGAGRTRFQEALGSTLQDPRFMAGLRASYDVRVFGFSEKPQAQNPDSLAAIQSPNGRRTSLGTALADSAAAARAGRVVLVSDGRDTAESFPLDAARSLKARGFAIDTVCTGKKTVQADVEVVARKSVVYAAPGQAVQVGAEIRSTGIKAGSVQVRLLESGRPVAAKVIPIKSGRTEVSFPLSKPQKGSYRLALQADPVPEERNSANNRASITLNIMNTQARVLFLEGRPSWDSKFLAQALRGDPSITLDVVYKLTDTKFFAVLAGGQKQSGVELPKTVDQFAAYDVVIFGKGFEEFYDEISAKALKDWVSERGGNVLFMRGRADERTQALRELEPVAWSGQEVDRLRLRLTEEGRSHPGFAFDAREDAQTVVKRMPPLVSASRVQGEKALAVVLARADDAPDESAREMATLAYLRYGQGKSMAIVGQGMWRWAFLPPDLENYGKVYQEFWSQVIRWMVSDSDFLPGQKVALHTDRSTYSPGEQVSLLGYVRGKSGPPPSSIALALPDGTRTSVASAKSDGKLADFTASYRPGKPGEYTASVPNNDGGAPATCTFVVSDHNEEDINTSADPDLMRQLAAVGGGLALTTPDLKSYPDRLKAEQASRDRRPEPRTAWDRPWILASLLAVAGIEWWLRRRWGLA